MTDYVVWFESLGMGDVEQVGGKNASLGEMISHLASAGVQVPGGFATTAAAYWEFLEGSGLRERINAELEGLDVDDVEKLAETGARIRRMIIDTPFPAPLEKAIVEAWRQLEQRAGKQDLAVAVRSSATAEDLPDASFAGQQETFLNVCGLDNVLHSIRDVFASLFNDRAISYRVHRGFAHEQVALSAGIQEMVRSDTGASGVMFTMDTESGFRDVVFLTASYGLGETVVQGSVNPDEFYVHKPTLEAGRPAVLRRTLGEKAIKMIYASDPAPGRTVDVVETSEAERQRFSLTDAEVESLARQALIIERHYGRPMDIEWGKDGESGRLYILQARPETVKSQDGSQTLQRYHLKDRGAVLAEGRAIGQRIGAGRARVVADIGDMHQVQAGDVLVTDMTDPDWEPIMKRAAAIVTNRGGRTCHAAIIARELGIPAVVGTGDGTQRIADGRKVTVSCAEGDTGYIYDGMQDFEVREISLGDMPELPFKIMMNVGNPDRAFDFAHLPNAGVGLARLEFIINRMIGIHPRALLEFDRQPANTQAVIRSQIAGYDDPVSFYVDKLAEGISTLAAAFADKPVIVRMSDFKSNEYANLIGGTPFEPDEENPMLGFRGASRYLSDEFRACFELECRALRKVREEMGFTNVWVMIPFVRTVDEGRQVVEQLAANGLRKGENGLKVIMMCELPSNAVLAEQFLEIFDGYSIGSNDLTQLTLGLDRDSGLVAHLFEERDPAVKALLHMAIQAARRAGKYVGICGQGPSDHPDLARWLMEEGIDSVSLNPDSVVETWLFLAGEEAEG
ncbi:phosphoenolpyruvate synthase [Sediminicurvatus halobius]|uniref:Phosphoenolpyruvate synthase n=1 Tax=Sediminicurvatus halobius TaxID=2182432 RepID=A0A2U2N5B3_9GAMM|nr:phosphoenolpyruvate synthase [Spiribacter halobius]PWG64263.1 phosphoenolpyruvate synthase [Spiribacter halobius]UEX79399.1 phosphoenolpyruvate synthase [Spiribacter halobius]